MKNLAFIILFLVSSLSYANICTRSANHFDNLTVQTGKFNKGDCFVSLSPRKTAELIYRSYLITNNAQILIFNSFGGGPINTDTGAKVFHTFPKKESLKVVFTEKTVEVTLVTGQIVTFDKVLGEPVSISEGSINIDPVIEPSNNGGVELVMNSSLILDSGFRLGGSPLTRLSRESRFIDSEGDSCIVKNREIFDLKDGEVYQLYDRPSRLRAFLKTRCPQIDY